MIPFYVFKIYKIKDNMQHYVFITTNLINSKQYVGDRTCKSDSKKDKYVGSGKPVFKNALKKYGKENFKKEILEFFPTRKEAFDAQEKYIKQFNILTPNGYNISPKGGNGVLGCHSEETIKKMSIAAISLATSGENNANFGTIRPEETRQKIRQTLLGRHPSEETLAKQRRRDKCKYCELETNISNLTRYHNENCKYKK